MKPVTFALFCWCFLRYLRFDRKALGRGQIGYGLDQAASSSYTMNTQTLEALFRGSRYCPESLKDKPAGYNAKGFHYGLSGDDPPLTPVGVTLFPRAVQRRSDDDAPRAARG